MTQKCDKVNRFRLEQCDKNLESDNVYKLKSSTIIDIIYIGRWYLSEKIYQTMKGTDKALKVSFRKIMQIPRYF